MIVSPCPFRQKYDSIYLTNAAIDLAQTDFATTELRDQERTQILNTPFPVCAVCANKHAGGVTMLHVARAEGKEGDASLLRGRPRYESKNTYNAGGIEIRPIILNTSILESRKSFFTTARA